MAARDPRPPIAAEAQAIVRGFRLSRGWNQRDAATWYGVTLRAWQRYESGERRVPVPLLNLIERHTRRAPQHANP